MPDPSANLRNGLHFPTVTELPFSKEADSKYYKPGSDGTEPALHWCFLAEVIELRSFGSMPTGLKVRDIKGNIADILISVEAEEFVDGDTEKSKCKVGNTIGILYPCIHVVPGMILIKCYDLTSFVVSCLFREVVDWSPDLSLWKIIPCSLQALYATNDKLYRPPGVAQCADAGCEIETKLSVCTRCRKVKYCSRVSRFP